MSKKVLAKFTPPPAKKSSDTEEKPAKKVKSEKKEKPSKKGKDKKKKSKKVEEEKPTKKKSKKVKSEKPAKKVKREREDSSEIESEHLHIRIAPSLLGALKKTAEKDDRKYANLAKKFIRDGLAKMGVKLAA